MSDHYIVEHDGTFYVHATIPYGSAGEVTADHGDGSGVPAVPTQRKDWWNVGTVVPVALVVPMKPTTRATGYRLPEGIHLDQFPDYMTADEMKARREGLDEDDEVACGPLQMYVVEREEVSVPDTVIDLTDHVVLEVASREPLLAEMPKGSVWRADLPHAIREWPQYTHLFPGYLSGFSKWAAAELGKMANVKDAYGHNGLSVFFYIGDHWERKGQVDRVPGKDLADAIANWHKRYEEVLRACGATNVVCPTCNGKGFVHD